MSGPLELAALIALLPAMIGSPPAATHPLSLKLCSGGTIELKVPQKGPFEPKSECGKACHSGCNRKRIDRAQ